MNFKLGKLIKHRRSLSILTYGNLFYSGKEIYSPELHRSAHIICIGIPWSRLWLGFSSYAQKMPKDFTKPRTELRHIRMKTKAISSTKTPGEIKLIVLGNGGPGNPQCLYMFSDHTSYMFNCGEGTQRLSSEYKLKLSKLEHVFFTYRNWRNFGGLLGLTLTVQSIGVPGITLHGPSNIKAMYSMASDFMISDKLMVFQNDVDKGSFTDNCMNVQYVPLHSANPLSSSYEDIELNIVNSKTTDFESRTTTKRRRLSEVKEDLAVAYICKLHNKPGKLCLEKCVEHNVPPGPLLGLLKSGKDVTLPDGTVVKAVDVVLPEEPGQVFIVVECPHEGFLDALISAKAFNCHQLPSSADMHPAVIIHFTPSIVLNNTKYREWMNKFPTKTYHLILNSDCSSLSSVGVHRIQNMLHFLHPRTFPKLAEPNPVKQEKNSTESSVIYADTMLKFSLRSQNPGLDNTLIAKLDEEANIQEAKDNLDFMESLSDFQSKLSENAAEFNRHSVVGGEFIFLGTGSSIPSKVRNVSSILWNLNPDTSIILDCGEGTYGQLVHFYGYHTANDVLSRVKLIFLSHMHADHHMGLMEILLRRAAFLEDENKVYTPVDILAPIQFVRWFKDYHKFFEPILHLIRIVPAQSVVHNKINLPPHIYNSILHDLDLKQLETVYVRHCKNAFGLVITSKDNWKVVYSGDTMPSEELVKAGTSCSLLIHEATMEDELKDEAIVKRHSTTSEAIEIGKKMKANFTLLTHFSQRYGKVPLFNDNFDNTVGCAFDNMRVSQEELRVLPLLIPSLKNLFQDYYEDMEFKTSRKCLRRSILKQLSH